MYEVEYNDQDLFDEYILQNKVSPRGEYDFTFENRYLLYHIRKGRKRRYFAFDVLTDLEFKIVTTKDNAYLENTYTQLIPMIITKTRTVSPRDYSRMVVDHPFELIDLIFRFILPENGYMVREEQIDLCKNMYNGFLNKQISICEAEVGTGKTLAYLVASLLAKKFNVLKYKIIEPVTIVTATIELQKALVEKEIPQLSELLYAYGIIDYPLKATLLKGRNHYFCRLRYQDYLAGLQQHPSQHQQEIKEMTMIGALPQGIDLDKYAIDANMKKKICVNSSCNQCPYYDTCRYLAMVRYISEERSADFQILNHNLYIIALKNDDFATRLMHSSSFIVIDEAHNFKNTAEELFGEQLSHELILQYIADVKMRCRDRSVRSQHRNTLEQLQNESSALFDDLYDVLQNSQEQSDFGNGITLSHIHHRHLTTIALLLIKCERFLPTYHNGFSPIGIKIAQALTALVKVKDHFYWLECNKSNNIALCCTPNNVVDLMFDRIWNQTASHVLTSGTMSDGVGFEYFKKENGLDRIPLHLLSEIQITSPFNYAKCARLYIPTDLPFPNNHDFNYIKAIADRILEIVEATNGHTAILFTSYQVLGTVYAMLQEHLCCYDTFCMLPGDKTAIQEFQNSKNGVLFASGSMWEGIDCSGDGLSSVIIVRLPFPRRSAQLKKKKDLCQDYNEFIEDHCIPNMLIKLRQGIGRLIRTETDSGVISILDSRAHNERYKKCILDVLSKYPQIHSIEEINLFIHSIKNSEYFE